MKGKFLAESPPLLLVEGKLFVGDGIPEPSLLLAFIGEIIEPRRLLLLLSEEEVSELVVPKLIGTTEYGRALDLYLSNYCIDKSESYFSARAFSRFKVASDNNFESFYHLLTRAFKLSFVFWTLWLASFPSL